MRFFFALLGGFVELFVVGEGVRIGTNDVRVDQRGAAALANIVDGFCADGVAFEGVGAVALGNVQEGKATNLFGNVAAGGLHFRGGGNSVADVFAQLSH